MSKTDLKKLSPEQLMQIAKHPIKEDEYKKLPPVKRFIVSDKLEDGKEAIPAALIYDRYVKWCNIYKLKPLSIPQFFKEFAKHFNKVRLQKGNGYILSPKGFDLSPQGIAEVNERYTAPKKRISNGKKKKEANQGKPTS